MPVKSGYERLAFRRKGGVILNENYRAPSVNGLALLTLINQDDLDSGGAVLYSLIDGAKFPGLGRIKLPSNGSVELHSLLGESAQIDAMYAGPILLRHARREHCPVLAKLLNTAESAHFLSLIVSDEPLPNLLGRLIWLTDVAHDDGTEWVMRYYDPLILPHWLEVLDVAQREVALAGIRAWLYIDVRGRPQTVGGNEGEVPAGVGNKPMLLNQHQCDELMNRTLPYMVMHQLESDDPQALTALSPYDRYDFFSQQLDKAYAYGLVSPTDLKSYCMLSLMFGTTVDMADLVATALKGGDSQQSFSERILGWTPQQWASLEVRSFPVSRS